MNKPAAYQWYVRDWLSSPTRLMMSKPARSAYRDLLDFMWDSGECRLPNDQKMLMVLADCTEVEWKEFGEQVMKNFVVCDEVFVTNEKLMALWKERKSFMLMASRRATTGANALHGKHASSMQQACEDCASSVLEASSSSSSSSSTKTLNSKAKEAATDKPRPSPFAFTGLQLKISERQDKALAAAFPWVDLKAEYSKADSWLEANQDRHIKNFSKFMHNWCGRIQIPKEGNVNGKSKSEEREERVRAANQRVLGTTGAVGRALRGELRQGTDRCNDSGVSARLAEAKTTAAS